MKVNSADCSWNNLVNCAEKCGFNIKEGRKHSKVFADNGDFITTIPRETRLNRYTAEGIIKAFQKFGCIISFR